MTRSVVDAIGDEPAQSLELQVSLGRDVRADLLDRVMSFSAREVARFGALRFAVRAPTLDDLFLKLAETA